MPERDVWSTLVNVIRETFDDQNLEISRSTTADDVASWDSLSNVELIVALESEFGVRFRTGELANLKSVGDLADMITRLLGGAAPRR
jgi:acyl carrier protein